MKSPEPMGVNSDYTQYGVNLLRIEGLHIKYCKVSIKKNNLNVKLQYALKKFNGLPSPKLLENITVYVEIFVMFIIVLCERKTPGGVLVAQSPSRNNIFHISISIIKQT